MILLSCAGYISKLHFQMFMNALSTGLLLWWFDLLLLLMVLSYNWLTRTKTIHHMKQIFYVLSRPRIEMNLISIMFLELRVNRRQVYRVCRCARSPVDHFRRKPTVRLNKIRMIEKVYDILYCNILWGMQCWVDYLRIVVCYWLQISWWKL